MITKFFVFGERCSGTNFLTASIQENFKLKLDLSIGNKHFFGHKIYAKAPDTIYFAITRDIVTWIDSLFKTPHHIAYSSRIDKNAFLNNIFFSVWDSENTALGIRQGVDIVQDYHIKEKRRYNNIFELRNTKNKYLLDVIPKVVQHYVHIRYEDLRDNYQETLKMISDKFNLNKKQNFTTIDTFKGYGQEKFKIKKLINFTQNDILPLADLELEKRLGYVYEN